MKRSLKTDQRPQGVLRGCFMGIHPFGKSAFFCHKITKARSFTRIFKHFFVELCALESSWQFLKPLLRPGQAGFWQIGFGAAVVILLAIFSFSSDFYQQRIEKLRKKNEKVEYSYATKFAKEPPAIPVLRRFLAPGFRSEGKRSDEPNPFELPEAAPEIHSFHYLGTDHTGRDILANLMAGARVALWGSVRAILISLMIGLPLGILSGYYGGKLRKVIDYLVAHITTLPKLITLIIFVAIWGYDFKVIMNTLGVLASPKIMEIVQNKIQVLKESQFIEAARELGVPDYRIIFKHILWHNCNRLIFVQLTYEIAEVILLESTLSYLGVGVKDQLSWGGMVTSGMEYLGKQHYWMLFFPTLAIVLAISGFLLLAEGLGKRFSNRQAA